MAVQLVRAGHLHDLAQIHDRHIVGDIAHDGQVVADEHIGQVHALLQLHQQGDDLRLNGHIQRGDHLVADDEVGLQCQRPGDGDALPLAAGELVGIAEAEIRVDANQLQLAHHIVVPLHLIAQHFVDIQALGHHVHDRHSGVQRREGILGDHLNVLAHTLKASGVQILHIMALIVDMASGGGDIAQQTVANGGLART